MLTYESFVAVMLGSIERAALNVAYTQELLDTHALGRSLSITCLPDGVEDDRGPQEPPLRAVIGFRWSPEFTVFSLRGGDSLDNIERMVDERLYAAQSGPSLDVEISYTVPLIGDRQRDVSLLPEMAYTIQAIFANVASSDSALRVEAQISYVAGRAPRVQGISALRTWSLDEALYDADLLADTFDELCAELHSMLESLAERYRVGEGEERGGPDALSSDRRYLKPPTA